MTLRSEIPSQNTEAKRRLAEAYQQFAESVAAHQVAKVLEDSKTTGAHLFAQTAAELDERQVVSRKEDWSLTQTYLTQRPYFNFGYRAGTNVDSRYSTQYNLHGLAKMMALGGWLREQEHNEKVKPLSADSWETVAQSLESYEQDVVLLLLQFPELQEKVKSWIAQIVDALDQLGPTDVRKGNNSDHKVEADTLFTDGERRILVQLISKKIAENGHLLLPFFKHLDLTGDSAVSLTKYIPLEFWMGFLQREIVASFAGNEVRHQSLWHMLWQGKFGVLRKDLNTKFYMARKLASLHLDELQDALAGLELSMSLELKPITLGKVTEMKQDQNAVPNMIFAFQALDGLRQQALAYQAELLRRPDDPALDNAIIVHEAAAFWALYEEYTQRYLEQLTAMGISPTGNLVQQATQTENYVQHDLFHLVASPVDELEALLDRGTLFLPREKEQWASRSDGYTEPIKTKTDEYYAHVQRLTEHFFDRVRAFVQEERQTRPDILTSLVALINDRATQLQMTPAQVLNSLVAQLQVSDDAEIDPTLLERLQAKMESDGVEVTLAELTEEQSKKDE